jgi:hypothetical protein
VAILAGGNITHNHVSVIAFNETSLILVILQVIMLIFAILYIDDKDKIEN